MTIPGGVRSLNARLARLELRVPEPQGPVVYRVMFADGTPVAGLGGDQPVAAARALPDGGQDIVYRIASWEEFGL